MTDNKLKPCPFCGGEAIIHYPMHNTVAILCSRWKCGATISMCDTRNIEKVVEHWNTRTEQGNGKSTNKENTNDENHRTCAPNVR